MKRFIAILIIIVPMIVDAQEILLEENVVADTIPETFGPNQKHYAHTYMSYGTILGFTGIDLIPAKSYEISTGLRYKYKISEVESFGINIAYNNQSFRITPSPTNLKEKLTLNNFNLGILNRISFGKRGNIIGKYLDIGGYCSVSLSSKYYIKTENNVYPFESRYIETTFRKVSYINTINYGLTSRIGWEWFAFFCKYRLSDITNPFYPNLPKWHLGIELSIAN